jgi:hypothetical protein
MAMLSYDQSPVRTTAMARPDSAADPFGCLSAPCLQYQIAGLKLDHQNTTAFSSDFLLEYQNNPGPRDWSQFLYKKSNTDERRGTWVHVEAGYGQFCQFESSLGEKTVELEQPSCAYLKASFSF